MTPEADALAKRVAYITIGAAFFFMAVAYALVHILPN
jgi:hypothetical protein